MSFAIFDEQFYLNSYPDVRNAVNAGAVSSGFAHFQQSGLAEGRVNVSPYFDEALYLRKYPDVAAAVRSGGLKSGLQHYIQYGEAEGRSPGSFNEEAYLKSYPDVAAAVKAGTFSSGLQHYIRYGQFESNRLSLFSGSTGNDTITGFGGLGRNTQIVGIDAQDLVPNTIGSLTIRSPNYGKGEVDTLIGGSGRDLFTLGLPLDPFLLPQRFYIGNGNADYAVIKNFEKGKDVIDLPGYSPSSYSLQPTNGNLNISYGGDLIATVEGVTSLTQIPGVTPIGTFQLT